MSQFIRPSMLLCVYRSSAIAIQMSSQRREEKVDDAGCCPAYDFTHHAMMTRLLDKLTRQISVHQTLYLEFLMVNSLQGESNYSRCPRIL